MMVSDVRKYATCHLYLGGTKMYTESQIRLLVAQGVNRLELGIRIAKVVGWEETLFETTFFHPTEEAAGH